MNPEQVIVPRRRTRAEVQELLAEFADSGMTLSDFCRSRGLSRGSMYRHLRKAQSESNPGTGGVQLLAVEVAGVKRSSPRQGNELAVVLTNGRRIEVLPGFDVATLGRLVSVLERA